MFDYLEKYKDYSNIELLKIIRKSGSYQTEAIVAAQKILDTRVVTPEDMHVVDIYFSDIEQSEKLKKEKTDHLKAKVYDFLEPIIHPKEKVTPKKWLRILLLLIGIQFIWALYDFIQKLIYLGQCSTCELDYSHLLSILSILFTPVVFYLLLKRKRWGWILLFADNLTVLIFLLSQTYLFFKYQESHGGSVSSFLTSVLIKGAFIFFLWSDTISRFFGINQKTKMMTSIVSGTIAILSIALITYF